MQKGNFPKMTLSSTSRWILLKFCDGDNDGGGGLGKWKKTDVWQWISCRTRTCSVSLRVSILRATITGMRRSTTGWKNFKFKIDYHIFTNICKPNLQTLKKEIVQSAGEKSLDNLWQKWGWKTNTSGIQVHIFGDWQKK